MEPVRPLRELFAALSDEHPAAADPSGWLAAHGYQGLPPDLVAEAIVNYADTAPVEVAEHLAPYVTAHSGVPTADDTESTAHAGLDHGFALLAAAPADVGEDAPDHLSAAAPVDALDGTGLDDHVDHVDDHVDGHFGDHLGDHFDDRFGAGDTHGVVPGAEGTAVAEQDHDLGVDRGLGFEHDPGWGVGLDEPLLAEDPFAEHPLDQHGLDEHRLDEHRLDEHALDEHGLDDGAGDNHPADDAGHPGP